MKPLLFSFLLSFSILAQAQNWCPPGVQWTYTDYGFDYYGYSEWTFEKDTVVDGQPCQKITGKEYTQTINPTTFSPEYTYARNDTVFSFIEGFGFHPIYFFNAVLGDTLNYFAPYSGYDTILKMVVDSVAIAVINGDSLRYYRAIPQVTSPFGIYPQSLEVVERFGALNNFLIPFFDCTGLADGTLFELRCYKDDSLSQYRMDTTIACDYLYNSISQLEQNNNITLYPNPATNQLNISIEGHTITQYQILDFTGKLVRSNQAANSELSIDVSELAQGVYLLRVQLSNGQYAMRRFINE